MLATEAMQLLIDLHDRAFQKSWADQIEEMSDSERESYLTATAICVAMLNTALPVAKYRAFVEIDADSARKKSPKGELDAEYTVCAVSAAGIRSGLSSLGIHDLNVRVLVFEQRETGADVVSAYQGNTKTQQYRIWYRSLADIELIPTIQ